MLNNVTKFSVLFFVGLLSGCAGGGYPNNNLANMGSGLPNGALGNPMNGVENAIMGSLVQNMTANVLNGQIGSQIAPADQNFRLQQLGNMVQSGNINQAQQWVNPQTGSAMAINPIGQISMHPQTQQQCQTLQETVTMPDGNSVTENRLACLNPQTGQWMLAQ